MTAPDPYLDASRLNYLRTAVPALAAHLGLALDSEGAPIAPTPGPLVEAVAALIYARHTESRYTDWDDLTPASRAPWIATAQGAIQLAAAAPEADEVMRLTDAVLAVLPAPAVGDGKVDPACAWSDYRKDYGVSADDRVRDLEHKAFMAGRRSVLGTLDAGGVQR